MLNYRRFFFSFLSAAVSPVISPSSHSVNFQAGIVPLWTSLFADGAVGVWCVRCVREKYKVKKVMGKKEREKERRLIFLKRVSFYLFYFLFIFYVGSPGVVDLVLFSLFDVYNVAVMQHFLLVLDVGKFVKG